MEGELTSLQELINTTAAWNTINISSGLSVSATGNLQSNLSTTFSVFVKLICVLVFLLGLIGNTLVLIVFGSRWSELKNCEVFMMSLAVADLIATVVVPVRMFLELIEHNFYGIGDLGCKLLSVLSMTTITVTALTLLVISIDRFFIVKFPFKRTRSPLIQFLTIMTIWIISFILSSQYLIGNHIRLWDNPADGVHSVHYCRNHLEKSEMSADTIATFIIQTFIPLSAMTVLYIFIVREIRKTNTTFLLKHNVHALKLRAKRNKKATIMFIIIVATYYVSVLPSNIFFMFYVFGTINLDDASLLTLYTLLQMIVMMNSCVNPIIYSHLHTTFRKSVCKFLAAWRRNRESH